MYSSQNIREKFIQFFEKKGHEKIASSSLVPENDPTLLFANAGMNQFKDYFTGVANPKNKRAVTIQKCVRAGGKHNDLENVGFTARHHTFFEMLGNFSFGDYFKSEAISFAWEFLTQELKIPASKLYVTVHDSDEEARMIWHKEIGIPLDRIFYMGDADNFWEMGETGPCGPCSEIFYDHGQEHSDGSDTSKCILADEGRYIEIWNLVFMQYEKLKDANGKITRNNLPKPCVDTGAGLERVAACMQDVYWNYDIDGFDDIKKELEKLSGKKYSDPIATNSIRVVADHIRSSVMLITDGVIPSNEGRGYVLRRIIRRAIRHMEELGIKEVSFYKLIPSVFKKLAKEYPTNLANSSLAEKLLKLEEEKFRKTLKLGLELLKTEISKMKETKLDGKIAFKLYDTYGFPLDLTETILLEKSLELDKTGFESAMKKQKESSRGASSFEINDSSLKAFHKIFETVGATKNLSDNEKALSAKLLKIIDLGDKSALIFNSTCFYPEGGGQTGDTGTLINGNESVSIIDTQKPVGELIAHFCETSEVQSLEVGKNYQLEVDNNKRKLSRRNHSATHLLQAALIEVLGDHIKQSGSRVSSESLRFDFTHPESVTIDQLEKVESLVNEKIFEELRVSSKLMTKDEAIEKGAMALFGEKYGDQVRVLEMGEFSLELCGGMHVENTNDIGLFCITGESSLASGVRRIEALTSKEAFKYLSSRSNTLKELERALSTNAKKILPKLESLQKDIKTKNKEIAALHDKAQAEQAKDLFKNLENLNNGLGFLAIDLSGNSPKEFRSFSDKFIDNNKKDVIFIYAVEGDKVSYLIRTDKKNNYNCAQIMKETQILVSGRGGGKPDMGQGSGEAKNLDSFIGDIKKKLSEL